MDLQRESLDSVAERILQEVEILTEVLQPVLRTRIQVTQDHDLVISALMTMYNMEIERMQQPYSC